jgi:hypothetical protein
MKEDAAELVVHSWNELNDSLYEGDWDEHLARHRPTLVFRGQANVSRDLRSSLASLGVADEVEEHLIRNFRKYAQRETTAPSSLWMWLAIGQHHGLPTRLLDWTHSPHVALHFATTEMEHFDCDALVWCINYRKTNQFLPAKLRQLLESEGSDVFTVEMLEQAAKGLSEWDHLSKDIFVAFWEPPSLDDRIVNQFAVFALLSNNHVRLDEWLMDHPECYRCIRIPRALKYEIRDRLDQANVTERILFPGLDGLCKWLRRYYSPRPS